MIGSKRAAFGIGAGILALGAIAIQQQQQLGPYVVPDTVRSEAFNHRKGFSLDPLTGASGVIGVNSLNKHFYIDWVLSPSAERFQILPVGYTPTSATPGSSPYEFLVAGTTVMGKTRVLRYTFDPPVLMSNGVLAPADLLSTNVILTLPRLGANRDIVGMEQNRGNPSTYFVRFHSSGDIYLLDEVSKQLTGIVASSDPASGAPIVASELQPSQQYDLIESYNHNALGFVYIYSSTTTSAPMFIMVDTNRDGIIDSYLTAMGSAGLKQLGLDQGYI